eukprot:scaffold51_cov172-Ochromonas_danica.AAC.1
MLNELRESSEQKQQDLEAKHKEVQEVLLETVNSEMATKKELIDCQQSLCGFFDKVSSLETEKEKNLKICDDLRQMHDKVMVRYAAIQTAFVAQERLWQRKEESYETQLKDLSKQVEQMTAEQQKQDLPVKEGDSLGGVDVSSGSAVSTVTLYKERLLHNRHAVAYETALRALEVANSRILREKMEIQQAFVQLTQQTQKVKQKYKLHLAKLQDRIKSLEEDGDVGPFSNLSSLATTPAGTSSKEVFSFPSIPVPREAPGVEPKSASSSFSILPRRGVLTRNSFMKSKGMEMSVQADLIDIPSLEERNREALVLKEELEQISQRLNSLLLLLPADRQPSDSKESNSTSSALSLLERYVAKCSQINTMKEKGNDDDHSRLALSAWPTSPLPMDLSTSIITLDPMNDSLLLTGTPVVASSSSRSNEKNDDLIMVEGQQEGEEVVSRRYDSHLSCYTLVTQTEEQLRQELLDSQQQVENIRKRCRGYLRKLQDKVNTLEERLEEKDQRFEAVTKKCRDKLVQLLSRYPPTNDESNIDAAGSEKLMGDNNDDVGSFLRSWLAWLDGTSDLALSKPLNQQGGDAEEKKRQSVENADDSLFVGLNSENGTQSTTDSVDENVDNSLMVFSPPPAAPPALAATILDELPRIVQDYITALQERLTSWKLFYRNRRRSEGRKMKDLRHSLSQQQQRVQLLRQELESRDIHEKDQQAYISLLLQQLESQYPGKTEDGGEGKTEEEDLDMSCLVQVMRDIHCSLQEQLQTIAKDTANLSHFSQSHSDEDEMRDKVMNLKSIPQDEVMIGPKVREIVATIEQKKQLVPSTPPRNGPPRTPPRSCGPGSEARRGSARKDRRSRGDSLGLTPSATPNRRLTSAVNQLHYLEQKEERLQEELALARQRISDMLDAVESFRSAQVAAANANGGVSVDVNEDSNHPSIATEVVLNDTCSN